MGTMNIINPAHMELTDISSFKSVVGSDYIVATGFHVHPGDIIHFTRATATATSNRS